MGISMSYDSPLKRIRQAIDGLDEDAWFQNAETGKAVYVRDLLLCVSDLCASPNSAANLPEIPGPMTASDYWRQVRRLEPWREI
jgi:hypothetical protein